MQCMAIIKYDEELMHEGIQGRIAICLVVVVDITTVLPTVDPILVVDNA